MDSLKMQMLMKMNFIENFDNPDFLMKKNESSVNKTPLSKVIENTKVVEKNKVIENE